MSLHYESYFRAKPKELSIGGKKSVLFKEVYSFQGVCLEGFYGGRGFCIGLQCDRAIHH